MYVCLHNRHEHAGEGIITCGMPVICEILRANEKLNMMSSIHSGKYCILKFKNLGYMGRKEDVHFCNSILYVLQGQWKVKIILTLAIPFLKTVSHHLIGILWTEKEKDYNQNKEIGGRGRGVKTSSEEKKYLPKALESYSDYIRWIRLILIRCKIPSCILTEYPNNIIYWL